VCRFILRRIIYRFKYKFYYAEVELSHLLINYAQGHEDISGSEAIVKLFLISAPDGGDWPASRPARFTPWERALGTHWLGGWMGLNAGLDCMEKTKIPGPVGNLTPVAQPETRRYADWAI
jgi:hypothetical protein